MDEAAKRVLKILKQYIIDNLCNADFPRILDYLENEEILKDTHVQIIQAENTDNGKIAKLLSILPRRGPNAFQALVDALERDNDFIAEKLRAEFEEEKERLNKDGLGGSRSLDSLQSLEESHHLCDKCLQDTSMDSNCNLYSTANQMPVSGQNLPIKVDKSVSTEAANHWTGMNGSCGMLQPMKTQHSEFMKKMWIESLNCIYTKLKSHLYITNIRELSFRSPEPVTFDMVDNLLDELIEEREKCFGALDAKDRHSLLTHVITLKNSKKELEKVLSDAQDQKREYIKTLVKEQNKSRHFTELLQLRDQEVRKLQEDKEHLEGKLQEKDKQLAAPNDEVDETKDEVEITATNLNNAEDEIKSMEEKVTDLQQDYDKLSHELKSLKGHGIPKRFGQPKGQYKIESSRNGFNGQYVISNSVTEEASDISTQKCSNNKQADTYKHQAQHVNTKQLKGVGLHIGGIRRGQQHLNQNPRKSTFVSEPCRHKGKTAQHQTGRQRINGREQPPMPLACLGVFGSSKK